MSPQEPSIREICTVSKVTESIKLLLEEKFPIVWVCGEISNLKNPESGHAYFTLKDEKAQISAVMFRGPRRQLRFELGNGITIVCMGRISVYEPRGTYQLIVEYVEPQGLGALQLAFEQLKRKLFDEGLFDQNCKKPIPLLPGTLSIITSISGAVLRDLITVIRRRFANTTLEIYPVKVQGPQAAQEISRAIDLANRRAASGVIIVARGGGSLEDLAAFNSETVARAIFNSLIPVVSAIGHETDFTIADFVADLRAPTPSAAAEMIVPVKSELMRHCSRLREQCLNAIQRHCSDRRRQLESIRRHLVHPRKAIQDALLRVDDLEQRLRGAVFSLLRGRMERQRSLWKQLVSSSPALRIRQNRSHIAMNHYKLVHSIKSLVSARQHRFQAAMAGLNALNPYAILQRGYSITRTLDTQTIVDNANNVSKGQELEIILAMGRLHANVIDRLPDWQLTKDEENGKAEF